MPYDPPDSGLNLPAVDLARIVSDAGPPPWRVAVVASPAARVVLLGLTPGTMTIPHHHPRAYETFQVISGVVGLTIGADPEHLVGPGSYMLASRGVVHGIRVPGPDPAVLMCTVTPNEDAPDEQVDSPTN
jgi:quercetin dioxygenase-like cupin family protein